MKKIKKTSELLWVFGIIFVALGVSLCGKADLGVSMIAAPAFILQEAFHGFFPFLSVGVAEYIFQGVLLILLCLIIRKFDWRFILAFVSAILYGYTLNFFIWLFSDIVPGSVLSMWGFLLLGDISTAFGVACFFRTYMPLQVYELFVAQLSRHFNFNINKVKWSFDLSLLALSLLLAFTLFRNGETLSFSKLLSGSFHHIGLGTVLTTAINSPLIAVMGKLLDKVFEPTALFPKIKKLLYKE